MVTDPNFLFFKSLMQHFYYETVFVVCPKYDKKCNSTIDTKNTF